MERRAPPLFVCLVLVALGTACLPARAAPLFEDEVALEAMLRGPLSRAYRQGPNREPREYQGQFRYEDRTGETVRLSVKFRQRGNTRRVACGLPPLRLNFVKREVAGTLFDGQDKLKLVGVCERDREYRDYLLLEYLAYRAYALLTPASFETRILELRYVDTAGKGSMRRPGFVIEDVDALADRLGLEALETRVVAHGDLDPDATALAEIFAFMIGNTDFSMIRGPAGEGCCHNVKLLAGGEHGVVPVPYDFDLAGLVDTPYALPAKALPIKDTRTRLFRGLCKAPEHFERARRRFLEKEAEILALFEQQGDLASRSRKSSLRYLRAFFALLSDPARFESDIISACIGNKPAP